MKVPRIVVVGGTNTDMVVKGKRLPTPGETVDGGDFLQIPGGKGANQAVAAARLGAQVTFVSRVGRDGLGREAMENLEKDGISRRFLIEDDKRPSGVALIMVDENGENMISVAPGANHGLSPDDIAEADDRIEQADVVLLQLEVPLPTVHRAVEKAAESSVPLVLNPAPARTLDDRLVEKLTVITPNETEAEILTGIPVQDPESAARAARVLLRRGVSQVIVTLGSKGSLLCAGEQTDLIPTRKVKPVDTTAAGDAFNAALCCRLAQGSPLPEAVQYANLAGALTATRVGAQTSLPSWREMEKFAGLGL